MRKFFQLIAAFLLLSLPTQEAYASYVPLNAAISEALPRASKARANAELSIAFSRVLKNRATERNMQRAALPLATTPFSISVGTTVSLPSGSVFHYIAPTGSDAADGLTAGTAWATSNHAMKCGEIIIAAPGTYTNKFTQNFGAVSNCPSTSGGIDGSGGIYFVTILCAGSDLVACQATATGGRPVFGWNFGQSNWAIQGFLVANVSSSRAFEVRTHNCKTGYNSHHIASINNVVYNSLQAFGVNDCGRGAGSNPPAADYLAVVGMIAQNSAQDSICLAAIDFVGTGKTDSLTTQIKGVMMGNFAYHSRNNGCVSKFDTGGFMFDTLDAHNSNGVWNFFDNIAWNNGRYGFQWEYKNVSKQVLIGNVFNNTFFANGAEAITTATQSGLGDLSFQSDGGSNTTYSVANFNNIAKANWANAAGGTGSATPLFAQFIIGSWTLLTIGGTGSENIFKGKYDSCLIFHAGLSTCDAGFNVESPDMTNIGTNFYVDPMFTGESDILTSKWTSTAPDCTGFENAAQCMGWDASTGTLTANTPISDLTPTCAQCTGKGYRKPTMACSTNSYFPPWLKGMVYYHWTGTTVVQKAGLANVPCGM
jgi:hypothetical protein